KECEDIGGCRTDETIATGAGNLKTKKIIHTPGPVWHGGGYGEADLLRNCYRNSLLLAKRLGLKTVAFPAISTGVYGYPIEEATKIALSVGKEFEKDFEEIRFICFSKDDLDTYQWIWKEIERDL
ncbi:MAG TPA: macro domain-containing protein, partial [Candidatus Omnitrophota bacterium]|nr:macro domain-containing protein [Candidatus Omnitrophota bacterium]